MSGSNSIGEKVNFMSRILSVRQKNLPQRGDIVAGDFNNIAGLLSRLIFRMALHNQALLAEVRQPLYRLWGIVREEQAFALVQLADGLHVVGGKGEVEYIEVLFHAFLVRGLGDDYHTALDEEAQGGLCSTDCRPTDLTS